MEVDCIIPLYNEQRAGGLIQEIRALSHSKYDWHITVVGDGSDPLSNSIARSALSGFRGARKRRKRLAESPRRRASGPVAAVSLRSLARRQVPGPTPLGQNVGCVVLDGYPVQSRMNLFNFVRPGDHRAVPSLLPLFRRHFARVVQKSWPIPLQPLAYFHLYAGQRGLG